MKPLLSVNSNNQNSIIDPLITASDAAKLLNVALITLAVWRKSKISGPAYVKVGKSVRYQLSAIRQFIDKNTVNTEEHINV